MPFKPGTKLSSAVCETQVIVVRAPAGDVALGCGGAPLLAADEQASGDVSLDPALAGGTLIGKRYADEERGIELLCTRGGAGSLTVDGEPLLVKNAKPLPSSD